MDNWFGLAIGAGCVLLIVRWVRRGTPRVWALDLGTTNTLLARWNPDLERPELLDLPALARRNPPGRTHELSRGVPSAVHLVNAPSLRTRHALRQWFTRDCAQIGQPALDANALQPKAGYASSFKRALSQNPLLTLARTAARPHSARDVAYLFLRELLAEARRTTRERIRDLVVTVPVDAYETYRAELTAAGKRLGLTRLRFIDEPVAAALGYGLALRRERRVLVVDFGGGTLHLALVVVGAEDAQHGEARVLAKAARDVGGTLVDRWVLEEFSRRLCWHPGEDAGGELWERLMLAEANRVKEAVYFDDVTTFESSLPETFGRFELRLRGEAPSLEFTREQLEQLLQDRGLYQALEDCLAEVMRQAGGEPELDAVLMVGGSTLLPGVYGCFEAHFGREKVRAWQPFEAVARGAAVFAGDQALPKDFIVHDYALVTHRYATKEAGHTVVIPRGTRFPTAPDFWKRQLVPTCALGEPQAVFKLVICELGSPGGGAMDFLWDADGKVRRRTADDPRQVVVELNGSSPAMGELNPPQSPRDRAPRLEVSLGVNAERWLCSTVVDLRTSRVLLRDQPVVRIT